MFCKNCGKGNPDNSNFCEHCGIKFGKAHIEEENAPRTSHEAEKHSRSEEIDSDTSPYPYVISVTKLIVLSVATFGLFEVYWFYKQWKSIRAEEDINVTPILRAIFATFTSYWLFKHISEMVKKVGKKRGLESGGLAIVYFILVATYKLPDPYWWVAILTFLPLIPAQNAINYYWEKKLGDRLITSGFGLWNYIWTFAGVVFLILALYGTFGSFEDLTSSTDPTKRCLRQTYRHKILLVLDSKKHTDKIL